MRIATLNVQSGGFESYSYEQQRPQRLGLIQQAVHDIGADVIGLTDTFRWHEVFTPADLRAIFGYDFGATMPIAETTMDRAARDIGLTVLSCRELIRPTSLNLGERRALKAGVEVDGGEVLSLFVAYLNHAKESVRVAQAKAIIARLAHNRNAVVGDLNTVSVQDGRANILRHALRLAGKSEGSWGELQGVLQGQAYAEFMAAGLQDANVERSATWPTQSSQLLGYAAVAPVLRVDHILVSPDVSVLGSSVPKSAVLQRASDHFPLVAEIA